MPYWISSSAKEDLVKPVPRYRRPPFNKAFLNNHLNLPTLLKPAGCIQEL
jgi:hypothetical protein